MSTTLLLLCIVYFIHLLITSGLGLRIILHKDKLKPEPHTKLSLIIAGRNEGENLNSLIESLTRQRLDSFEVIIVNDRSTDSTETVLETKSKTNSWLTVVHVKEIPEGWTGKKYAIYRAVKKAKGEFLVFTDADCLPNSNQWLETIESSVESNIDVILGYSPYIYKNGVLNQFIQWETMITALQYLGFALFGKPYMGVGRNMAIRKKAYDLAFLESIKHLEGGDDDLMIAHIAKRENTKVLLRAESQTYSQPKNNLKDYLKQKTRHLAAGKYYHQKDQTLLGFFTLSWVVSWSLLIYLLLIDVDHNTVLMAFGIRSLLFYSIMYFVGQKLKADIKIWTLPFLDLCYCLYYPLVAIRALATKKVEWK